MKPADKIADLQKQIDAEQNKIDRCHDEWGETYSDAGKKMEPYGHKVTAQGSDIWFDPEGYREVSYQRWARKCKKCGKVEHTEKSEPVTPHQKPVF